MSAKQTILSCAILAGASQLRFYRLNDWPFGVHKLTPTEPTTSAQVGHE